MKKKKLISLVLAGTMVFGLAACGSNGGCLLYTSGIRRNHQRAYPAE